MPDRTFIGIDPGTHCGWAVLDAAGNRLASGTWDLSSSRHEGGGMRYVRMRRYLREMLDTFPDGVLAYEEVSAHRGTAAAHIYGGIIALLAEECEARGLPYSGIPVATVKRHATGKGNSDKVAMVAAARGRWGEVADDNEADAIWIADAVRAGR
jgi:Holliday junction resolvasome RuvABC endonuclease subunit